jgi:hypothetical protein
MEVIEVGIGDMLRALWTAMCDWIGWQPEPPAVAALPAQRQAQNLTPGLAGRVLASNQQREGRMRMNAAYEKLIQHLEEQNIGFWARSDDHAVYADFRGAVGTYRLFARVDAEDSLFQVFGHSPVRVPVGCRAAIAETITRANCGLKVGKFEMDCDEGDVRFQTSQILSDDNLDDATIRRMLGTTMAMLDLYLPAILSVIYGNELPGDAIRHVEPARKANDPEPDTDA